jgi:DNA-binding response OmpR family regulator
MHNQKAGKGYVLIVESDMSIGILMEHVLTKQGYKTTLYKEGLLARKHIATQPPCDLVLLDLATPFVSGYDLLEQIREQDGGWGDVPVILTSAKSNSREAARGLEAGANDFIAKPFHIDELVARIRRYVKSARNPHHLPGHEHRSRNAGRGYRGNNPDALRVGIGGY